MKEGVVIEGGRFLNTKKPVKENKGKKKRMNEKKTEMGIKLS